MLWRTGCWWTIGMATSAGPCTRFLKLHIRVAGLCWYDLCSRRSVRGMLFPSCFMSRIHYSSFFGFHWILILFKTIDKPNTWYHMITIQCYHIIQYICFCYFTNALATFLQLYLPTGLILTCFSLNPSTVSLDPADLVSENHRSL
jgi:hypothetical protein